MCYTVFTRLFYDTISLNEWIISYLNFAKIKFLMFYKDCKINEAKSKQYIELEQKYII